MSVGEYAADARAAVAELRRHPEVTRDRAPRPLDGRARARSSRRPSDDDVDAVIAVSTPADPYRLTRQTFRLARLPIPGPIAWPLAWLTTRVYLRPRGHTVGVGQRHRGRAGDRSAGAARPRVRRRRGPARPPRAPRRRPPRGPPGRRHRDARRRGRPALVAVRVPGVPGRDRAVPDREPGRPVHARRGRRRRGGRPRRAPARSRAPHDARRGAGRLPFADGRAAQAGDGRPGPEPRRRLPDERPRRRPHEARGALVRRAPARSGAPRARSSTPGDAPTAPRTSSAGRSSSSRTASGSPRCRPSARTPATSPAPRPPSPSSRPTRTGRTRR